MGNFSESESAYDATTRAGDISNQPEHYAKAARDASRNGDWRKAILAHSEASLCHEKLADTAHGDGDHDIAQRHHDAAESHNVAGRAARAELYRQLHPEGVAVDVRGHEPNKETVGKQVPTTINPVLHNAVNRAKIAVHNQVALSSADIFKDGQQSDPSTVYANVDVDAEGNDKYSSLYHRGRKMSQKALDVSKALDPLLYGRYAQGIYDSASYGNHETAAEDHGELVDLHNYAAGDDGHAEDHRQAAEAHKLAQSTHNQAHEAMKLCPAVIVNAVKRWRTFKT